MIKALKILTFILTIVFVFSNCNKDEKQAEKSIKGAWEVVEINSYYGQFLDNGFNPTETIKENGALGSFVFTENLVDFNFTRNDTIYTGSSSWELSYQKIQEGFFKIPDFSLKIKDEFLFDVTFEDATKNAEKNATNVTFLETPTEGFGVMIELTLEKR